MRRALLAALLLLAPSSARAMPAPPPPGTITAPASAANTLELVDAKMRFECSGGKPLVCAFVATYRVHNATASDVRQAMDCGTSSTSDEITIDGQPVETNLSSDEVLAVAEVSTDHRRGTVPRPIAIVVPAGATRTLKVRGSVEVRSDSTFGFLLFPANSARHVVFANHQPEEGYWLRYGLRGLHGFGGDERIELELVVPEDFAVDGPPLARVSGTNVYRATVQGPQPGDEVRVRLHVAPPILYPGGILAGIGGSTGEASGLRLRVGGELAIVEPWLLGSVVYETNARSRHYIVPAVHAALPMLAIIPSLGAGLGVPVQLAPTTRVGARVQFDLHLGPLGFLTTIDWYPRTSSEASLVQPSFLFQVGL